MLLELAKPASLLASIFSLLAVFHAAFLGSETDLRQRIFSAAGMLLMAAAVSLASGLIFTQQTATRHRVSQRYSVPSLRTNVLPFRRRISPSTHAFAQPDPGFKGLIESFPMRVFYWAVGLMAAPYLAAWFIETCCIPLSRLH